MLQFTFNQFQRQVRSLEEKFLAESTSAGSSNPMRGSQGSSPRSRDAGERALGPKKKGDCADYRFREGKGIFIAPTICGGECLQAANGILPPFMAQCNVDNAFQKWDILPYAKGEKIGHNLKAASGLCVVAPVDCATDGDLLMGSCDDPRAQLLWVDTSFNFYYCWQQNHDQPKTIDFEDACNGNKPEYEDDEFYYNNIYFLDECGVLN